MLKRLFALCCCFLFAGGVAVAQESSFFVESASFKNNEAMPLKYAYNSGRCTGLGENVSPELHWINAPEGTKSFAVVSHDPDAPVQNGWYHWFLINIPASQNSLPEGVKPANGMKEIKNSFGILPYGGPCPPSGTHRYNFTVYALSVESLDMGNDTNPVIAEKTIKEKALASATITGLFSAR